MIKKTVTFLLLFIFLAVDGQNLSIPLIEAVKNNDLKQTQQLIENSADINVRDENNATVLMWAAYKADFEIFRFLVEKGADYTQKGIIFTTEDRSSYYGNLIAIAVAENKIDLLKFLYEKCNIHIDDKEFDWKTQRDEGWTALQWASYLGRIEAVNYLIDNGANINIYNITDSITPLIYSLQNQKYEVAMILIEEGADLDLKDNLGWTALHYAARDGSNEVVDLLLVGSANPNLQSKDGYTPLMLASFNNNFKICISLIENGANSQLQDNSGNNAMDFAIENGYSSLYNYLLGIEKFTAEKIDDIINAGDIDKAWKLYNAEEYTEAAAELEKILPGIELQYGVKDTSNYAIILYYTGVSFKRSNNNEKAEQYYLDCISVYRNAGAKQNQSYAKSCNNLALIYNEMGNSTTSIEAAAKYYRESESLYIEAKEINKKLYGKHYSDYILNCNNLAILYDDMSSYALTKDVKIDYYQKSALLYIEVKTIRERTLGVKHPDYAESCYNLASLYKRNGDYPKAESLYLEAKDIYENVYGNQHLDYLLVCNDLAVFYHDKGDYQKAKLLYIEIKNTREKVLGNEHPYYATSCNNLATLYYDIGDYQKAESLFIEVKNLREEVLGNKHSDYAISSNNLASFYNYMGNYTKAEPLYIEAKEVKAIIYGKQHPSYAKSCNNLGALYDDMGNSAATSKIATEYYKKAESLYIEAKNIREKVYGKEHPSYATSCNNLALLYSNLGAMSTNIEVKEENYKKAELLYIEAKTIREKTLGTKHLDYAVSCNNLALLYNNMRYFHASGKDTVELLKRAEPLLVEAKNIIGNIYGNEHPSYAASCINLALLYNNIGNSSTSFEVASENYQKAEPLFIESLLITNKNIHQNFSFFSEKEKEKYLQTLSFRYELFNSFALNWQPGNPAITSFVFNNALNNKSLLLKSSLSMRIAVSNSVDSGLIATYKEWQSIRSQLASLYSTELSKQTHDLNKLEAKLNELEKVLVVGSENFSDFKKMQIISWQDIQKELKPNEVAIEFVHFDYYSKYWEDAIKYCALLVKPDSEYPEMITLFTESDYENCINSTNNSSNASLIAQLYGEKRGAYSLSSNNTYTSYADSLYSFIWSKIDRYLDGVETVYYSPSGLLHNISFAAIPYNDSLLLSDKYELVYMASTRNIVNKKLQKDISEFNVAIYGGLNYDTDTIAMLAAANNYNIDNLLASRSITTSDSTRGGTWNYLQGTLDEAENIESMFDNNNINTNLFTANNGVEESFKSLSGRNSPEIIHLATHGFFFPDPEKEKPDDRMMSLQDKKVFKESDNPLIRSGLIMSGANLAWNGEAIPEGIDDGILTAYEVSGLDLYNTELVVLSACETGLGDIKGSEGVYGLQRSFKMAGVDYLVMSLWQVPDKETSKFMQLFYQNMLAKQSVGEAFRNAQKVMKKKYDPYYWAAFVLIE